MHSVIIALTDVEFGNKLETIGVGAFHRCPRLQRIAIPLKDIMSALDSRQRFTQFDCCGNLTTVVGGIYNTISSLLSVINRMEHYRAENHSLLKEDMTQLELAIWKAMLDEIEEDNSNRRCEPRKPRLMLRARGERDASRLVWILLSGMSSLFSNWDESGGAC